MTARLVALAGPLCGEAFPIDGPECVVGRDPANRLSIPDRLMSRRHCTVTFADGRYYLRDLGSSNGTFVNGIPVGERVLEHGDRIRAGDSVLMFLTTAPAAALSALSSPAGTVDDRTTRVGEALRAEANRRAVPDSAGEILAEVLAGRVTLQAHDMVGDSQAMRLVYGRIRKLAPSDCTVLISGETGTGKELAARAIHQNSPRARRPFVAINCAALTESLLESELFGHEKGAFTGALSLKKGRFEIADGGTIFLDEIGELAPPLQSKLLRALQYHEFERVGGTRTVRVDVRVVAATNRDLAAEVAAGKFRQDLWYRLNVVNLTMPPLRERREDIPSLAAHFAAKYARGRVVEFSPDALQALTGHDWPGNVRELENAIERAVVLGSSDRIAAEDLPDLLLEPAGDAESGAGAAFHDGVRETKRRLILEAIDRSGGNYAAAARLLGLNPTYLHRLLKNLQIKDVAARR
jgi:transcriptional regulator with GAF, ATPase, and Fis domain